jgi:cbb3-type cytochrome oxidase subunit 1
MAQDDKKANTLCWISVLCSIVGMVLMSTYGELELPDFIVSKLPAFVVDLMDDLQSYASMFLFTIGGLAHSAGFVLMIIARVKYPKNTFAKVLMWIYIIGIVLSVIATILVIASCLYCASQCRGF